MIISNLKPLRLLLVVSLSVFLFSCEEKQEKKDDNNVISKFNSTWNIYEKCVTNEDGSITYKALPWGGLVGNFLDKNMPVDLSNSESITFVFSEPTTVPMQIVVAERFKTWGKIGISSLTCNFDGQDVTSVNEISLQAGDTCTITVTQVYLTPKAAEWESTTVWQGDCHFGNWENGFVVRPEKFETAYEGDKLEFFFSTDRSPDLTYWLIKTIYSTTESTLEGNYNELNDWGCAFVAPDASVYRIVLTANDVANLREKGLFINGFHVNVTQCNLLKRHDLTYLEE